MNIRLSEKHGVNPSLILCGFCGEDSGIALMGKLPQDAEAPKRQVSIERPCQKCETAMKSKVFLVMITDDSVGSANPTLKGISVTVEDWVIRELVTDEALIKNVLSKRFAFIPETDWIEIGIPTCEADKQKEDNNEKE